MSDPFIGSKFGVGGHLEVVGACEREKGKYTRYKLICSVCEKDEMYKGNVYISTKNSLSRGSIPCNCVARHLTEKQQTEKITKECLLKGLEFLGYVGEYKGIQTKLNLRCLKDGHEWNSCIVSNLFTGKGCPKCTRLNNSERRTKSDEESIDEFISTGSYVDGTRFWKLSDAIRPRSWAYYCPICSVDEYVEQGLCSGVFTSVKGNLTLGAVSCRCSNGFKWSPEQRTYQINKRVIEENLPYEFLGWSGEWKGNGTTLYMRCKEHGDFFPVLNYFINSGYKCPSCSPRRGYDPSKDAFVYVLMVDGINGGFTGYGITGNKDKRLKHHRRNLSREGLFISEQRVFPVGGEQAIIIENAIKESFICLPQLVEGFKTEATHSDHYTDVVNFVIASAAT